LEYIRIEVVNLDIRPDDLDDERITKILVTINELQEYVNA